MVQPDSYAVIGNPVAHSRSPQIHALFAAQTGQPVRYERLLADEGEFDASVDTFFANGGKGLNVTVPFKLRAYERALPHVSARARAAGAVNTLWQVNGVLHGCNTDGIGLVRDLQRLGIRLDDAKVLLIGAGGAARGVLLPLVQAGCARIHIVNRTAQRAIDLAAQLKSHCPANKLTAGGLPTARADDHWNLAINASSSSLSDEGLALPEDALAGCEWAYDMMYAPQPTPFLVQAQAAGAHVADGLGMLVEQAAESFNLWRGVQPQTAAVLTIMRSALQAGLPADADIVAHDSGRRSQA